MCSKLLERASLIQFQWLREEAWHRQPLLRRKSKNFVSSQTSLSFTYWEMNGTTQCGQMRLNLKHLLGVSAGGRNTYSRMQLGLRAQSNTLMLCRNASARSFWDSYETQLNWYRIEMILRSLEVWRCRKWRWQGNAKDRLQFTLTFQIGLFIVN
jgi:hypothetical protein